MKRFLFSLIKPEGYLAHFILTILALVILLLGIFDHLDVAKEFLDSKALSFNVGEFSVSLYDVLKGAVLLIGIFWLASVFSAAGEKVIRSIKTIRPGSRSLIVKGYQVVVYFFMTFAGLKILGIDLTVFAVFGGAIGIGLGFGLRKIASNFISGIILLFERSIESGDWIELDEKTQGIVKKIWARHTLIETFDNKEVMIPNEDFISCRVINWTHSNKSARMRIDIGVSYESDIRRARELLLEAANEHEFTSKKHEPQCHLINYGESSVDFVLFFWIDNVMDHYWVPRSEIMMNVWDKFKENNISIPYPQHDLHIKNPEALKVS